MWRFIESIKRVWKKNKRIMKEKSSEEERMKTIQKLIKYQQMQLLKYYI